MNDLRESDVFGLQYLEDTDLELNDVVGCSSVGQKHDVLGFNE